MKPTTRKILVRIIASMYVLTGLWKIGVALFPLFGRSDSNAPNWLLFVIGALYFRAGDNLYNLQEFGRKLTIVLLSFQLLLVIGGLRAPGTQNELPFAIDFFGMTVLESDNAVLYAILCLVVMLAFLGTILLLLNKKTGEIFATPSENASNSETSQVLK